MISYTITEYVLLCFFHLGHLPWLAMGYPVIKSAPKSLPERNMDTFKELKRPIVL